MTEKYRAIVIKNDNPVEVRQSKRPIIGGYKSMKKYGSPDYCPSATRHHLKAKSERGDMPNLTGFNSVREAVMAGYSPCGNCWIKGGEAKNRWQEYLQICNELDLPPVKTPKIIMKAQS